MKQEEKELKLLQEIESIPKTPQWNKFFCVDGLVKLTPEIKSYLELHHYKIEDKMPKEQFMEICNKLYFPVKLLNVIDTRGLTSDEIKEKVNKFK